MLDASSASFTPRLPLDVIEHIVQLAGRTDRGGEFAHSASLVCRDLRAVSQGLLFEVLTLPGARLAAAPSDSDSERLLKMVRTLRWREKDFGAAARLEEDDPYTDWCPEYDVAEEASSFVGLLARLGRLTAFETFDFPIVFFKDMWAALLACPSLPIITRLVVVGEYLQVKNEVERDEGDLLRLLELLPSLITLEVDLSEVEPPPPLLPTPCPRLRLSHFSLGAFYHTTSPPVLLPSSSFYSLLHSLTPASLTSLELGWEHEADGWVRWLIDNHASFTSLRTLTLRSLFPPISRLLSLLSPTLVHFLPLTCLFIYEKAGRGIRHYTCHDIYEEFLPNLPTHLEEVGFFFPCPPLVTQKFLEGRSLGQLRRMLAGDHVFNIDQEKGAVSSMLVRSLSSVLRS